MMINHESDLDAGSRRTTFHLFFICDFPIDAAIADELLKKATNYT